MREDARGAPQFPSVGHGWGLRHLHKGRFVCTGNGVSGSLCFDPRGFRVLGGKVCAELLLSLAKLIRAASCALLVVAVPDEPCGIVCELAGGVAALGPEPKSGAFGSTRHRVLIRSMFASVV